MRLSRPPETVRGHPEPRLVTTKSCLHRWTRVIFKVFSTDPKHGHWLQLQFRVLGSPLGQVFSCWIVRERGQDSEGGSSGCGVEGCLWQQPLITGTKAFDLLTVSQIRALQSKIILEYWYKIWFPPTRSF